MKVIIFLLTFIAYSFAAKKCPPKESLAPCTCDESSGYLKISCSGSTINEQTLTKVFGNKKLSNEEFEIWLEKTSVKKLSKSQFGQNSFEIIHIYDNLELSDIEPDTFEGSKDKVTHIFFFNCTKLPFKTMLDVIHNLPSIKSILMNGNNIKEIPAKAFQPREGSSFGKELRYITIENCKISSIGSYAFNNLPKIRILSLEGNQINNIDSNGLTFNRDSEAKQPLSIRLIYNNLTENSFKPDSIQNNATKIQLAIAYNPIKYLPEQVFKQHVHKNGVELYAKRVNFTCDCHMKWMLSLPDQDKQAYHDIQCNNFKKNIFQVNANELGKCN